MGYSFQKSHPDVAYVKTSGGKFVPSDDWVSVVRANDKRMRSAISAPVEAATAGTAKQVALAAGKHHKHHKHSKKVSSPEEDVGEGKVFNWEDPPPDHAPVVADKDKRVQEAGRKDLPELGAAPEEIPEESPEVPEEKVPEEVPEEVPVDEVPVEGEEEDASDSVVVDLDEEAKHSGSLAPAAAIG